MERIKISVIIPAYNAEKSLARILKCVENQTLKDFEALIVNDGSSDNTQKVIDEFCKKDNRFHGYYQKNQGVSAARNNGLDHARGKYITFYDADDTVPVDSMEALYKRAEETGADLVVGGRTNSTLSQSQINKQAMRFAQKPQIDKYDEDFAYSFGLWNKLFSREIIEKNGIRFEAYRNANDGIFVFTYLKYCDKIVGCDKVVYEYRKRLFFEAASISQIKTYKGLETICNALDHIKDIHDSMLDKDGIPANDERRKRFDDAFFFRIANVTFLDHYYRHLWLAEDDAVKLAINKLDQCREKMSAEMFDELVLRHIDINIDKGLLSKEDIVRDPDVIIVISEKYSAEDIGITLASLYDQLFPYFAVYVPEALYEAVDTKLKEQLNMHYYKGSYKALVDRITDEGQSEYLMLIDDAMCFDPSTLRSLVRVLKKNPDKDMSMVMPYTLNIEEMIGSDIKVLHKLYKKIDDEAFNNAKARWYDRTHVNKLIKTSVLKDRKKKKAFLCMDWSELGRSVSVQRVPDKQRVFVKMTEEEVLKEGKRPINRIKRKVMELH